MKFRIYFCLVAFSLFFTTNATAQYCDAAGASGTTSDWISKVRLYDLVKTSAKSDYSDFTFLSTELTREASYPLYVHMNGVFDLDTVFAWIDFNQDNVFGETERVLYSGFTDGATIAESEVTVPADAVLGATRMRVRAIYINRMITNYPCDTIFGEVEDYTVMILDNTCTDVGMPCDDGMDCSINDTIDANCNCRGTIVDDDLDGVCNEEDECPGVDDNLDLDNNGIPDLQEDYCAASGSIGTGGDYINRVRLYDINQSSIKSSYTDFTDVKTDLVQGVNYEISVHAQAIFSLDQAYGWIDYNQNNKFEESEAFVMEEFAGLISTGVVAVPEDALLGETRMRVRIIFGENIENPSCGDQFGEVEDYTVNIIPNNCDMVGQACDDGNECSINDVIDANCNCRGEIVDSDFDGVCDEDDICPGADDTADLDNNGILDCQDYCVSQGLAGTGDDYIKRVSLLNENFETIDAYNSGKSQYSDFTEVEFVVQANQAYNLEVLLEEGFEFDMAYAWIDYDSSMTFEGSEFIEMSEYFADTLAVGSFTTPDLVETTSFRLRVRNLYSENGDIDPCNDYFGEVEDYTLTVLGTSTGTKNASLLSYQVYPNPASSLFYLSIPDYVGQKNLIEVSNVVGQIQYRSVVNDQQTIISTTDWAPGIYYIQIKSEQGIKYETKRIMVY